MFFFDYESAVKLEWKVDYGVIGNSKSHEDFGDENLMMRIMIYWNTSWSAE
jgi:hypothetical protein